MITCKRCAATHVQKPRTADHFHRCSRNPDKLQYHCKACQTARRIEGQNERNRLKSGYGDAPRSFGRWRHVRTDLNASKRLKSSPDRET